MDCGNRGRDVAGTWVVESLPEHQQIRCRGYQIAAVAGDAFFATWPGKQMWARFLAGPCVAAVMQWQAIHAAHIDKQDHHVCFPESGI